MFEITPDDIAQLNDEKLRVVVARLCEAELRKQDLSPSHVTCGGNQNAADGGIDVRVALPPGTVIDGFVPRTAVGFQVKQQDMPRAEILSEMHPDGVIRASIRALANQSGAYIIVSSQGSTSDTAISNRRDAMKEAMQGVPNADLLLVDFYDRTRLATWVRSHEGLIPWVREQVGRAIQGWHSYGSWAYAPDPITAEYLLDDKLRIHPIKRDIGTGVSALEGIRQMRDQLRKARSVVRLVGLSGVGKTRLVQALFDDRVGVHSLDPGLAMYTNIADSPEPQPTALASNLVAAGTPGILIVDNCPPELHQRLSEVCRHQNSKLSVITVEYDIREDEPEGTEVFTMETSSPELIERLLRRQFPAVSQTDAHTVAKFSDGNSRIAFALAATIKRNDTVAGLTDDQLFQRLFVQRHAPDKSLYLVAQSCSLLYSFEGEDVSDGDEAELIRLGTLVEKTAYDVYRNVAELQRRDLVQRRGAWRAVLPHAVANRLAAIALENFSYEAIEAHLLSTTSGRLMKSFSRRLGYLHVSSTAKAIVKKWLEPSGLLGDVSNLNDLGKTMFKNIAPVAPDEVISALERMCAAQPAAGEQYLDLLRSLAYDPAHFGRCMTMIIATVTVNEDSEQSQGRRLFASLFQLHLSGTNAIIEQRLAVLEQLFGCSDPRRNALAIAGLKSALKAWQFDSVNNFDFGARPRDFGYSPRTTLQTQHWFATTFKLVEALASNEDNVAQEVRAVLAEAFRDLWLSAGVWDELATLCRKITRLHFWPEGWLAVRQALDFDGEEMSSERLAKLVALEQDLRPVDLCQKVRSVVLPDRVDGIDFEDFAASSGEDFEARIDKTQALAKSLGKAVSTEEEVFASLLLELVSSNGRLWWFGGGLVEGTADAAMLWDRLITAFTATKESLRRPTILCGVISALHVKDPVLTATLLDNSVEHATLSYWYPILQVAIALDQDGVARLKHSLAVGKTPAHMFLSLAHGRATDPIPPSDLKQLVLKIAGMEGGYNIAVEILYMRLHSDKSCNKPIPQEFVDAGCALLEQLGFSAKKDQEDYQVGAIVKECLRGDQGAVLAGVLCAKLKDTVKRHRTQALYHDDLLEGLFSAQPEASLEGLFGATAEELNRGIRLLRDVASHKQPLAVVPQADLLHWCDQEPLGRYAALASLITIFEQVKDEPPRWSTLALIFLERAPVPTTVLHEFVSQFLPSSAWSGSPAAILQRNAVLLEQLDHYPCLRNSVANEKKGLQERIEGEQYREAACNRQCDERFE